MTEHSGQWHHQAGVPGLYKKQGEKAMEKQQCSVVSASSVPAFPLWLTPSWKWSKHSPGKAAFGRGIYHSNSWSNTGQELLWLECAMSTRLCFQCLAWSLQNSLEDYMWDSVFCSSVWLWSFDLWLHLPSAEITSRQQHTQQEILVWRNL